MQGKPAGRAAHHSHNAVTVHSRVHGGLEFLITAAKQGAAGDIPDIRQRFQPPAHRGTGAGAQGRGVVAQLVVDIVGIGAGDQKLRSGSQGKTPVVFQQDGGVLCQEPALGEIFIIAALPGGILRHIGIFKQPQPEFQGQDPLCGGVDGIQADEAPLHRLRQLLDAGVPQAHVHPCADRKSAGGGPIPGHRVQLVDGHAVGHDKAPEAVLVPEKLRQEPVIRVAVGAVDFIVGGHEGFRPGLHAGLYRGQVNFPQLPGADPGGAGIDAPGGLSLGAQVLGNNGHALAADALHHGRGHLSGKVGVLPEAFFTPAPPGVPEHIQGGDQGQVNAHFLQLPAADLGGFLHQLRGERGSRRQIDRQKPAVQGLVAVGAFGAQEHRDPQPGVGNDIFLHHIGGFRGQRPV